jgi:hypothetical protein
VNSAENLEDILEINRVIVHSGYLYISEESKIKDDASSNQHLESKLVTLATSRALNYFCGSESKAGFSVRANLYGIAKHKVIIENNIMKVIVKIPVQRPECKYPKIINPEQNQNLLKSNQDILNQTYENDGKVLQLDNKTEY